MIDDLNYLKVLLNKDGTIISFESTLIDGGWNPQGVVGKNWFDTFIESSDKEIVLQVFNDLFDDKTKKWKSFKNDIKCLNGSHRFIDFTNEIILIDGQKHLSSVGVEHVYNG